MKIHLARQGDNLQVYSDEVCIVVRDRYRHARRFTKKRPVLLIDIETLLSASKNLGDGETIIYNVPHEMVMENNIDRAISTAMSKIPKKDKRIWLNESIQKAWPCRFG